MFRLKDLTAVLCASEYNKGLNVNIHDHNDHEIDYDHMDKYMNLIVTGVKFVKELDSSAELPYYCDIKLSNTSGDCSITRELITYDEIVEVCKDKKVIILPVDSSYNNKLWDGKVSLTEHFKSEAVIDIIPMFGKDDYIALKIILTDDVQIVHIPIIE